MSKDLKLNKTGASCKLLFLSEDNLVQNILKKTKKSSNARQNRKTLISVSIYF